MFSSVLTLHVRLEKKADLVQKLRDEIVPLVRRSAGALEFLVFQDDVEVDRFLILSLWQTREDAERYHAEGCKTTASILGPYLTLPLNVRTYRIDNTAPRSLRPMEIQSAATPLNSKSTELKIVRRR